MSDYVNGLFISPTPLSSSSSPTTALPPSSSSGTNTNRRNERHYKRSHDGCYTCRLRRKKCDETHPTCRSCLHLNVRCQYNKPTWWQHPEQRRIRKEELKERIKNTKVLVKNSTVPGQRGRRLPHAPPLPSPYFPEPDFNLPVFPGTQLDPFGSQLPTPALGAASFAEFPPYEVDVRTDRQLYVNDIQTRHDSSVSTFNTFVPPQMQMQMPMPAETLPLMPDDEWTPTVPYTVPYGISEGPCFSELQMAIPVEDEDRHLLDHFVQQILRLIFPILEVHQKGHERAQSILRSLESNKSYLHCCLSVAAIHLKTTGVINDRTDHEIMRHRYEAVSQLCESLNENTHHEKILEATLAMVLFHCAVGQPDEYLPDIAWTDHFSAATNLINRLDLHNSVVPRIDNTMHPPFNMLVASWIDILGATMLCRTPRFANTYRDKHLNGDTYGFRELMGCDDRVMYIISEIACLDALRAEGSLDDMTICTHVSALGQQLDSSERSNGDLEQPYSVLGGGIRPDQLTENMTIIFRLAARIYLCSLVPGFDKNQASNFNLVERITSALQFIPCGPNGYDRSLVWPFLITGAFSTPYNSFRQALRNRVAEMGGQADYGSFGRMYHLLQEYWRLSDDPVSPIPGLNGSSQSSAFPIPEQNTVVSPTIGRELKRREVHWRDVLARNGWHYLLL